MDSRLFTLGKLAERWGVNPKTIRTMVRKGEIAHFQVDKQIRFIETEIRKHEGWTTKSRRIWFFRERIRCEISSKEVRTTPSKGESVKNGMIRDLYDEI